MSLVSKPTAENEFMAKVLLIEDDGETAEEITAELAERGFEVEWSANGVEGLNKARSSRPDAMIVDRLLPGMDGLTVIETLRKDQVRTPVLVLSALGAVDDRVRGLRMGGDDYLTKPFALVELVARLDKMPEPHLVRPRQSPVPTGVVLEKMGRECAHAAQHQDSRQHRHAREVAVQDRQRIGDVAEAARPLAAFHLHNSIESGPSASLHAYSPVFPFASRTIPWDL